MLEGGGGGTETLKTEITPQLKPGRCNRMLANAISILDRSIGDVTCLSSQSLIEHDLPDTVTVRLTVKRITLRWETKP